MVRLIQVDMPEKKPIDRYSDEEAERRLHAALRGARLAGPQHKESVTPKRVSKQPKRKRTQKK